MMEIKLYNGGIAVDDRGSVSFVNDFNFSDVKRFYQVENHRRGFIRAWHAHEKEGKYVYVATGSALVGAIPLVDNNLITIEGKKFILSAKKPAVLFIPAGYGNGFMNLEEGTSIVFFSTRTLDESLGDDIRFPFDTWNIWSDDFR